MLYFVGQTLNTISRKTGADECKVSLTNAEEINGIPEIDAKALE